MKNNYSKNSRSRSNSRSHSRGRGSYGRPTQKSKGPKKENIHPSKFVKSAKQVETKVYSAQHRFDDFNVNPVLKSNIRAKGFSAPSPIQDQIIPHGLVGKDVIGIANTGTGKTVAFAVPVIDSLLSDRKSRALIVTPTRELAEQVLDECRSLAKGGNAYWALVIGGASMGRQLRDLSRRPNLVIGTPGRLKDHLNQGSLKLGSFTHIVLDEVDRMLDMGFVHDMREIIGKMPESKQSFFFSATMDQRVRGIINDFSKDPVEVSVKTGDTSDNVDQSVVHYNDKSHKIEQLHDVLNVQTSSKVLIFDDTRRQVEQLSKELQDRGFKAESIHGGRSQSQRRRALTNFKDNKSNVLVATDVAARGIDVEGITHVINYNTPQTYDDYVHRIGRAGRAGRSGYALTFLENTSQRRY